MKTARDIQRQIDHMREDCARKDDPETPHWIAALEWVIGPPGEQSLEKTIAEICEEEAAAHSNTTTERYLRTLLKTAANRLQERIEPIKQNGRPD